jgi:hypothetical protein
MDTKRTHCRGQENGRRCRRQATHIVTGGDWYCEHHAAEAVATLHLVPWGRSARSWPESPETIAELASVLGRSLR